MAVSADGVWIAYGLQSASDPAQSGVWLLPQDGSSATRRIADLAAIGASPTSLSFSADAIRLLLISSSPSGSIEPRVVDISSGVVSAVAPGARVTGAAWSPTGSTLAYVTFDPDQPSMPGGLFVTDTPGEAGRLMVGGAFMAPACCGQFPFMWATDNSILLTGIDTQMGTVTLVRLSPL
jgi:hypothetical protein